MFKITQKRTFREHHLLRLLQSYDGLPIDVCINKYFRSHKALGSKDRALIADIAYAIVRWKDLLDYFSSEKNWESRYRTYLNTDLNNINSSVPLHISCSCPLELFNLIKKSHGENSAREICITSNSAAPVTIRVNTIKTTRESLFEILSRRYKVSRCKYSKHGIVFHQKVHFKSMPEFKAGFFEVQDEGSQLIAQMVSAEPKQQIMDYCCGAGGKTLAFAPQMQGTGQIYLHDIRSNILLEAKKRLKRAKVQNFQILKLDNEQLIELKKKMDCVFVDVPCSGTGTMRRHPDMKWNFNLLSFKELLCIQRSIFENALSFMKPQGKIVYATCSILEEENQQQIDHFVSKYNLKIVSKPFQSIPTLNGMDGFFGTVMHL